MPSIIVKSLPLKEVLKDIASDLGVPVVRDCDEYSLKLPNHIGQGTIHGMEFNNGLAIIVYDCWFHEDTQIRFVVDEIHPVKFLFCEKGQLIHCFEDDTSEHVVEIYQNAIVASSSTNGHILSFKAGVRIFLNSLEINREVFIKHLNCEIIGLGDELEFLFNDIQASKTFYYLGNYCLKMADLFIELNGNFENSFLKKLFWKGSAFHILNLQILQFQNSNDDTILRKREVKLVKAAVAIIKNDILDYTTVQNLANAVGITELKLQNGFKYMYDSTVNDYVKERRLDLARNLLTKSDNNISEIVHLIGLSSRSYFSKIFKEKYKISPSALKKKISID